MSDVPTADNLDFDEYNIEFNGETSDLLDVLLELKGEHFLNIFLDHGITVESLKYLNPNHLDTLCPSDQFGKRVIFEYNLVKWQTNFKNQAVNSSSSSSPFTSEPESNLPNTESYLLVLKDQINIEEILGMSGKGNLILSFYKKNVKLTDELRKMLADILIEHLIQHKVYASPKLIEHISEGITKLFKSEVKETYFISVAKPKPKGILYQKYHNTLTKLRRHNLWICPKKKNNSDHVSCEKSQSILHPEIEDPNLTSIKKWLKFNVEPMSEIKIKWQETAHIRQQLLHSSNVICTINDILEEWPMYKQSFGHNLVDIDFEYIYPTKGNCIFDNWDQFIHKVIPLMINNIKDGNSKVILKHLLEIQDTDLETRNLLVLSLMNALLIPTSKSYAIDVYTNKRRIVKTSIADACKSFLLQLNSMNDLHVQIQVEIDNCYKKKETLQPCICVVGADTDKDFYVYYFNTYYKFSNIVRAVDVCFKIFQVFNLKYPIQSILVWTFFQKYFYNIHCEVDIKSSSLISLINDLSY